MEKLTIIAPVAGAVALIFAVIMAVIINKKPAGNDKMKEEGQGEGGGGFFK